jgi:KDO2-lipid IV(A) lauroyltransferase
MARHETPDSRDRLEYLGFSALLRALQTPSRLRARRMGRALGRFVARAVPLRREVALANLRAAFPERSEWERVGVYRGMCETMGMTLAEFAQFGKRNPDPVSNYFEVEGAEHIGQALEGGRGALLLTAHFGNWEALGASIAEVGYPLTALGARQRNPLVEEQFSHLRRRVGMGTLVVGKSLRPILELWNQGTCLATLADQDGGKQGFFLEFLGRKASVQSGLFRLAARRGVPVVTGFAVREGEGWRGKLMPPLRPEPTREPEEVEREALRLAAAYTAQVERLVREHPDHWLWVHRRWHTRPEGGEL